MKFTKPVILVSGATGQQGGSVVRALCSAGWRVRALVRQSDTVTARALVDLGCTLAVGDQSDRNSINQAMTGANGVFSVQPSSGQSSADLTDDDEIAYAMTLAEAARDAGVQHFVQASVIAAGHGLMGVPHFDSKAEIERRLRALDLPVTIVRPATFMELLMLPGMSLEQGIMTFLMRADQKAQFVAVPDIGRIVAAIFADPDRFVGKALPIASDEVTGDELAAALSRAAGRQIEYRRFSDAALSGNAILAGAARLIDDGRLAGNADLSALRDLVPGLYSLDAWLNGPGKPLLQAALTATSTDVALR